MALRARKLSGASEKRAPGPYSKTAVKLYVVVTLCDFSYKLSRERERVLQPFDTFESSNFCLNEKYVCYDYVILYIFCILISLYIFFLDPVARRLDNAIHQINRSLVNKC